MNASLALYEATKDDKYRSAAISYGNYILQCQQRDDLNDRVPLKGFFFGNASGEKVPLPRSITSSEKYAVTSLVGLLQPQVYCVESVNGKTESAGVPESVGNPTHEHQLPSIPQGPHDQRSIHPLLAANERLRSHVQVGIDQTEREDVHDHETVFAQLKAMASHAVAGIQIRIVAHAVFLGPVIDSLGFSWGLYFSKKPPPPHTLNTESMSR